MPEPVGHAKHSLIGESIAQYVIQQELARGGMGVVYLAQHAQLGQRAAVKVLAAELLDDPNHKQFVARFFDEARAITRLKHPNIVKIFDLGQLPSGIVYILMEFLDGEPLVRLLDRYCVRGGMPVGVAVSIAQQLASAMSEAHRNAVLHRDLKPANVIVVSAPETEAGVRPIVIDFGLARMLDSPYRRTKTGTVMGTPLYMSPEQCMGEDVDDKSDVYSLGTMLYEMLCGHAPFEGAGPQIFYRKATEDPPSIQEQKPDLPPALCLLVAQMIQHDRAQRLSMQAVGKQLRRLELDLRTSQRGSAESVPHAATLLSPTVSPPNAGSRADAATIVTRGKSTVPAKQVAEHFDWSKFRRFLVPTFVALAALVAWLLLRS